MVCKCRPGPSIKDLALDGKAPLLLTAYGSYGAPRELQFSLPRISLLERGVVYVVAQIRGVVATWDSIGMKMAC